ncbi:MAG: outer membrane lipoprotein-sorting protein [Porticoccaceae bacterium]|nr:outer membrane lipoprotein-sorting protein [Porticoccaceae bacterium]
MYKKHSKIDAIGLALALFLGGLAINVFAGEIESWRIVDQLLPAEAARVDLRGPGPRDSTTPYIPAEPYPYTAPYTVEQMTLRAMEFTQHARWSSVIVDVYGTMTGDGYLDQGVTITYKQWLAKTAGVQGQIDAAPGEVYQRMIHHYTYPPRIAGQQHYWQVKRSDQDLKTRLDMFVYTPALRRVRRIPQPQRDVAFGNNPQSFDAIVGRDAWEFDSKLLGADVLEETIRFPNNRPNITLRHADGSYYNKAASDIKLMGEDYKHYTTSGGVPCFVIEARPKKAWLDGYYDSKLVIWLDQQNFYPLRIESYNAKGELILIEERSAWLANPALGALGYAKFNTTYFDPRSDLMSFTLHDAPRVLNMSDEEGDLVFRPDFMRRNWLKSSLRKSQALVPSPEQYFLRPHLYLGKFPATRTIEVPDYVARRIVLQDEAGHLVFDDQVKSRLMDDAAASQRSDKSQEQKELLLGLN